MNVQERKGRDIPKRRWLDTTESGMRADGVCIGNVED